MDPPTYCESTTEKSDLSLHYHTKIKKKWYSKTIYTENAINNSVCCIVQLGPGIYHDLQYDIKTFLQLLECDTEYIRCKLQWFFYRKGFLVLEKIQAKKYFSQSGFRLFIEIQKRIQEIEINIAI